MGQSPALSNDFSLADLSRRSSPPGNLNWFIDHVELAGTKPVESGAIKAFEFDIRAPTDPGTYAFQWRLMHPKTGPFGDRSEAVSVRVTTPGKS